MSSRRALVACYVLADLFSGALAWTLFYIYRKMVLEPIKFGYPVPVTLDANYYKGVVLIPLFWFGLYTMMGGYREIQRRFRILELGQTLLVSVIGVIVIFFVLLLDDQVANYNYYYRSFMALFGLHFGLSFLFRIILTSSTVRKVHDRRIGFNTVLVGGNESAKAIHAEIETMKKSPGNHFVGFVNVNGGISCSPR